MNNTLFRIIVFLLRLIQFNLSASLLDEAVTGVIQSDRQD